MPEVTAFRLDDHERRIGNLQVAVHDLERSVERVHGRLDQMKTQVEEMANTYERLHESFVRGERDLKQTITDEFVRYEKNADRRFTQLEKGQDKLIATFIGLCMTVLAGIILMYATGIVGG